MKHILLYGNVYYGGKNSSPMNATPHVADVLECWANETGYKGSLSDLPIIPVSMAEMIYYDENEEFPYQSFNEFQNLIDIAKNDGALIIVTTSPMVDASKLDVQYHHLFKNHFHTINNWNKQI